MIFSNWADCSGYYEIKLIVSRIYKTFIKLIVKFDKIGKVFSDEVWRKTKHIKNIYVGCRYNFSEFGGNILIMKRLDRH